MKNNIVFLIIILHAPLQQLVAQIDIEPVWVRVGDSYGAIDVENVTESVEAAVFSPDETLIASGAKKGVHGDVNQLQFSKDDQWLLSAGRNGEVKLWKITEEKKLKHVRTYSGHSGLVKSVRLSPDEKYVAAGAGSANGVRIWNFETGELVDHIPATGMIMETIEFTPNGEYLFTGGNEGEGKTGEPIENPGFENKDGMGHIRAYKVPDKGETEFELVMEKPVFRQEFFDFTDDGKLLVSSHEDGTLRLWKVHYGD